MSITLLAVAPSIPAAKDCASYALRLSADHLYERYAAVLEDEAGQSVLFLSEEEACFLYWLADLQWLPAEMVSQIFRDMPDPALAVDRLASRLSAAGLDADVVFYREGTDYRLTVAADRQDDADDVSPAPITLRWTDDAAETQAVRNAA